MAVTRSRRALAARLLLSVAVGFYAGIVPWLEWNDTHVFNAAWPAHARLHEVWQLATNCALGLLALWLIWRQGRLGLAAVINGAVMGGFFLAYVSREHYGGAMVLSDGTENLVMGMNIGVFGFGLATAVMLLGLWLNPDRRRRH